MSYHCHLRNLDPAYFNRYFYPLNLAGLKLKFLVPKEGILLKPTLFHQFIAEDSKDPSSGLEISFYLTNFLKGLGRGRYKIIILSHNLHQEERNAVISFSEDRENLPAIILPQWVRIFIEAREKRQSRPEVWTLIEREYPKEVSGFILTDSFTSNETVIESWYGQKTPKNQSDVYVVNKNDLKITKRLIFPQKRQAIQSLKGSWETDIAKAFQKYPKLTDHEVLSLAEDGLRVKQHLFHPQTIHFFLHNHRAYIDDIKPHTYPRPKISLSAFNLTPYLWLR